MLKAKSLSAACLCAITWTTALDTVMTHLVAIDLLFSGQYWLSGVAFSFDSGLRVISAALFARIIAASPEVSRGRCSFILKCACALLSSAVFLLASGASGAGQGVVIALFVLAKVAFVSDGMFGAHLIYKLKADRDIALSTSAAALNIMGRGATSIAPALSLAMIHSPTLAAVVVACALFPQAVAMWLSRRLFVAASNDPPAPLTPSKARGGQHETLLSNPFTRWGLLFALLGNLSMAGVTLLLMRFLHANETSVLNEISVLYFAFFASQILVLLCGDRAIPASTIRGSSAWLHVAGALTIGVALSTGALRLAMCVLLGAAYSILLSSIAKCLLPSIGRNLYVSYSACAQPIARGSSMAATLLIGAAMSHEIGPSTLLLACGIAAFGAATTLFIVAPARRLLSES